jgi:hypothetical protein
LVWLYQQNDYHLAAVERFLIVFEREINMKRTSLYRLGGICSILLGVSYVVAAITSVLMPPVLDNQPNLQSPFMYFEQYKTLVLTNWWALLLGAVFALAVIPAVSATVMHLDEGWVRWTSTLATIAFAVVILDNYWSIVYTAARADAYATGSEAIRSALTVPGAPQFIDVQGWLATGAVGLWVLVISLHAMRGKVWPKGLAYLGIVGAIVLFMLLVSTVIPTLFFSGTGKIVAGIGAVLAPVWFTWLGIFLHRFGSYELETS